MVDRVGRSIPGSQPTAARLDRTAAAVVPAIADLDVHIDADAARSANIITAEIARFDSDIDARFAPFATLLLRSESAASSQIENLTARAKAILMAEAGDASRPNATIIASNTPPR